MSATHATLGAASDERKARLAKLKSLKRKQLSDEVVAPESARSTFTEPDVAKLYLSGRNYDPESKGPKLGFETQPNLAAEKTLEQQAKQVEDEIKKDSEEKGDDNGMDLFKLQPKKPNWDLKRDLDKKLDVLNARTENAIAQIVRQRIQGAQKFANGNSTNSSNGGEKIGMDGVALVESVKMRERNNEYENKKQTEFGELQ
ncbi:hypothetical protein K3495_g86 [Podosphaera aphanis]|nr:hypothetical protein K3495_g86 [Podosphaera aphanis]